jgi:hypothetical protein
MQTHTENAAGILYDADVLEQILPISHTHLLHATYSCRIWCARRGSPREATGR